MTVAQNRRPQASKQHRTALVMLRGGVYKHWPYRRAVREALKGNVTIISPRVQVGHGSTGVDPGWGS